MDFKMEPIIYLQAQSQFCENLDDKSLRQNLKSYGIDGRRLSRFTNLALLGILPLREQIPTESVLYLASSFNSPSKFDKMFHSLMSDNLPSPLDFMANLGNATTFQITQSLALSGPSVFVAVDKHTVWHPLWLAFNELSSDTAKTVVVGWAYERCAEDDPNIEGSQWLVLSNQAENAIGSFTLSSLKQFMPRIGNNHPTV